MHRLTLPDGSDTSALWELVSELHAEPLDRSAPLWMAYLIDGLADDRCALYIKIHHIVVDGVAGLQMIADSLSTDPDRRDMPPFYASAAPDEPTTKRRGFNPLSVVRDVAGAAASGLNLARHVASAEVANIVGGLITPTVAAPFGAPHTRFNTKLGPRRIFAATSLDRNRIRAIQQAADVTGNDVVTALVAGVLRDWLAEQDELPSQSLVALCPVTVRERDAAGPDGHGNQFGLGLCPLATAIDDPAERLSLVHARDGRRQASGRRSGPRRDADGTDAGRRTDGARPAAAVRFVGAAELQPADLECAGPARSGVTSTAPASTRSIPCQWSTTGWRST